ncbi:DNA-binding CsgD family transcriptional regulator [Rubricella aquisinus]|uniref:DNA-binding CsgD family transcriptional regulator n=1 Tax=Rubricella aquisinus TaxID=2028108 RepID=A0A840X1N8_9RHOB|nr:LuxR family transcriptional regulator [Rubricella aquisinus]MBB5515805.1 DNA-binding CsgD family transcriptional regulator [Rubricella aquisinus]
MTLANQIADLIDALAPIPPTPDGWAQAMEVLARYGVTAVNLGDAVTQTGEILWMRSSMQDQWLSDYVGEGFYEVDPVVAGLREGASSMEMALGQMARDTAEDRRAWELDHGMRAAGYATIFCQPFAGPKEGVGRLVNLTSDLSRDDFLAGDQDVILRTAMALLAGKFGPGHLGDAGAADTLLYATQDGLAKVERLSDRERDVLRLLALGHMNARIADLLQIAEVTVRAHLKSARRKLGAATREQALAIAMARGLITL